MRRAVFAYRHRSDVSIVMLVFNGSGEVIQVTERGLDAVSYMRPRNTPGSERLKVESIEVLSASPNSATVRLTLGPREDVSVRTVDIEVP
jgi:hypothetical protein